MRIGRIRIGSWALDRVDGTLTGEHATVRLEPKVLAVLLYLLEHRGAVVLHEDLLRDVWKDTHVVPGALARTISLLRTALGDDAYHPRYIETVPKRGYRWIAAVDEIVPERRETRFLRPVVAAATAAVLAFVVSHDQQPMQVLHRKPGSRSAFNHQTRAGNETALEHYAGAVDRNPASAEAHAGLATAYLFRANYLPDRDRWAAAAVESAKRAVALDAHSARAASAAGMAHLQAGRLTEAATYFHRALEMDPDDCDTLLNLGRVLMFKGDLDGALELYRARLTAKADVHAYAHVAEGLWLTGRRSEALDAARTAAALEPFAREPQLLLARNELISGDGPAARARLLRLLQAYPDCTQCIVQLGLIEQVAGNLAGAEARYREAAAMPAFPGARLRLAHVLSITGRREEAAPLLQQVEDTATAAIAGGSAEFAHPRWNLAAAAAIRGDRRGARQWFTAAQRLGRRDTAWDAFEPMFDTVRPLTSFR